MFGIKRIIAMGRSGWINTVQSSCASSNKHGISVGKSNYDFLMGDTNQMNINGAKSYSSDIPCKKYMDVKCKTALITGGTTGIGLAIADSLLAAGLEKAYLSGIDSCSGVSALLFMNNKYGIGRCDYIPIDVNNSKQFEDAFKYITCREGNVDILVNNAGMLNDRAWELEFDTNVYFGNYVVISNNEVDDKTYTEEILIKLIMVENKQ